MLNLVQQNKSTVTGKEAPILHMGMTIMKERLDMDQQSCVNFHIALEKARKGIRPLKKYDCLGNEEKVLGGGRQRKK